MSFALIINAQEINLTKIAGDFSRPVDIRHADDDRLFIVEQSGKIWQMDKSGTVRSVFLDLSDLITDQNNEQGLLGLAFHPNYTENGYFFVNYTDKAGNTVISRYTVSDDPNIADPQSQKLILQQDQPFPNHNGGNLAFGPDGYLYIGLGDGGAANDPQKNGQNHLTLLAKMLRIDIDTDQTYKIPPDNPFTDDDFTADEIWALGLRNPWRYTFDKETGDLWIADVGQDRIEEIDLQPASSPGGENYGWRCKEGSLDHRTQDCPPNETFTDPVYEYNHNDGDCSITGGYVYRGEETTTLFGHYIYADICTGSIWKLIFDNDSWENSKIAELNTPSCFGEDQTGELYVASLVEGNIYKFDQITSDRSVQAQPRVMLSYPNPTKEMIHINFDKALTAMFRLFTPQGRLLLSHPLLNQERLSIDVSSFPDGLYLYRVSTASNTMSGKIIRQQ